MNKPIPQVGDVCYDMRHKEYIKVTNGKCRLDHSSVDGFRKSHDAGNGVVAACEYSPHECIAIRAFINQDGSISLAFTYRGCDEKDLQPVTAELGRRFEKDLEMVAQSSRKATSRKVWTIGRV